MRKYILLLCVFFSYLAKAQTITVPANIYFADQRLIIEESGQKEIQKMVDALTRYPKYYQLKVDLADTYFPIIERVFREEGLPEDFKYLALQESGLSSDAVSTSNAVGFWQFKKEAASDYGLRINQDVDERKHIIESSRSAARYFVKNNTLYYHNWHNTLLSYMLGFTGAKSHALPEHPNRKEMVVTNKTHHYILTYLAHKVAFENAVGRNASPLVMLQEIPAEAGKTLDDVALEVQVPATELRKYNKWLAGTYIPGDKNYTILVPVINPEQEIILAARRNAGPTVAKTREETVSKTAKREFNKLNGLKVIIARQGDTKDKLALEARLSTHRFLAFNDLHSFDPIVPGEAYYIQRKKSKASVAYHVVKPGERVQQIAQKYGVKVKSILWNNRMKHNEALAAGRLLWLQHRRPSHVPVEFQKVYPDAEPTRQPSNPVILAKDEVLDELNTSTASASSQIPDETRKPAKEYTGGKLSGEQPPTGKPIELDTETFMETVAEESDDAIENLPDTEEAEAPTTKAEKPIDVALARTNEQEEKTQETLSQQIDQQVETINKTPAPTLYKKSGSAEPVAATSTEEVFTPKTKAVPAVASSKPATAKPAVILKEPATDPKIVTIKPDSPEPAGQVKTQTSPPVVKESAKRLPAPVQTPGTHVVAKGETLYSISKTYSISIDNLKDWNNLGDMPLGIGQILQVTAPPATTSNTQVTPGSTAMPETASTQPTGKAGQGVPATHTVTAGESMYQISRKYGVTIKDIMEWNNKADFNVKPGEQILIKATAASRD